MPNATLEELYKNNAEALGIEFPQQADKFAGGRKSQLQTKGKTGRDEKEMKTQLGALFTEIF